MSVSLVPVMRAVPHCSLEKGVQMDQDLYLIQLLFSPLGETPTNRVAGETPVPTVFFYNKN